MSEQERDAVRDTEAQIFRHGANEEAPDSEEREARRGDTEAQIFQHGANEEAPEGEEREALRDTEAQAYSFKMHANEEAPEEPGVREEGRDGEDDAEDETSGH